MVHAHRAHCSTQIGRIDQQAHISFQVCAPRFLSHVLELGKIGPIQNKICHLRVAGLSQCIPGLLQCLGQCLRQCAEMVFRQCLFQGLHRGAACVVVQMGSIGSHCCRLQCNFCIMIVIFEPEDIHQLRFRGHAADLLVNLRAPRIQRRIHFVGIHGGQIFITAVGQQLCRIPIAGCIQHPVHSVPVQHLGFSGPQHRCQTQIIPVCYF